MKSTKKRIFVSALIGALLMVIAVYKIKERAITASFVTKLLQAHNVGQSPDTLAITAVEAKRLAYHYADPQSKSPRLVLQQVAVYFKGNAFRREKRNWQGQPLQIDLSDGEMTYRSGINGGGSLGHANQLEDWESPNVEFKVLTFGVIPLLRRLQNSAGQAVYFRGEDGQPDRLKIEFASVICTLYFDEEHLIRKVEMVHKGHFLVMTYDEYKTVAGIQLPFKQLFLADGMPVDELEFIKYDLSPSFAENFFSPDSM